MAPSAAARRLGYMRITLIVAAAALGLLATALTPQAVAAGSCDGRPATIVGTSGNDILRGTGGSDVIKGKGGKDELIGRGGRDHLCGGKGDDTIKGGRGNDRVFGGSNNDTIRGGSGNDGVLGFAGVDSLFGGDGNDFLDGGEGAEGTVGVIDGGPGNDSLFGRGGNDDLFGGDGNDDLDGGPETDKCLQDAGNGSISNCEADLSVDVSGPATASPGAIAYAVKVTNNGPSDVDYAVLLDQDNNDLSCPMLPWEGLNPEPNLAAGQSRSNDYDVNCTDEGGPGGTVFVDATVSAQADTNAGNNNDRQTTTVN